jgi:hypothetical protein
MAKILFTISYDVNPEHREEYLALAREMKKHLVEGRGKKYAIYEQRGKKDSYVEVFFCDSVEEYDTLEDDQDEKTEELVQRLEPFLRSGKMKYVTLIEAVD